MRVELVVEGDNCALIDLTGIFNANSGMSSDHCSYSFVCDMGCARVEVFSRGHAVEQGGIQMRVGVYTPWHNKFA